MALFAEVQELVEENFAIKAEVHVKVSRRRPLLLELDSMILNELGTCLVVGVLRIAFIYRLCGWKLREKKSI